LNEEDLDDVKASHRFSNNGS